MQDLSAAALKKEEKPQAAGLPFTGAAPAAFFTLWVRSLPRLALSGSYRDIVLSDEEAAEILKKLTAYLGEKQSRNYTEAASACGRLPDGL